MEYQNLSVYCQLLTFDHSQNHDFIYSTCFTKSSASVQILHIYIVVNRVLELKNEAT